MIATLKLGSAGMALLKECFRYWSKFSEDAYGELYYSSRNATIEFDFAYWKKDCLLFFSSPYSAFNSALIFHLFFLKGEVEGYDGIVARADLTATSFCFASVLYLNFEILS